MVYCPSCGKEVASIHEKCPGCGTQPVNMVDSVPNDSGSRGFFRAWVLPTMWFLIKIGILLGIMYAIIHFSDPTGQGQIAGIRVIK